jgi:signal transduction histidine kinase
MDPFDRIDGVDRVAAMLTALMDISEAETGAMALHREMLDVRTLLRETAELYEDAADEKGVSLAVEATADLTLPGDRTRLRQALANFADNAIKYEATLRFINSSVRTSLSAITGQ